MLVTASAIIGYPQTESIRDCMPPCALSSLHTCASYHSKLLATVTIADDVVVVADAEAESESLGAVMR